MEGSLLIRGLRPQKPDTATGLEAELQPPSNLERWKHMWAHPEWPGASQGATADTIPAFIWPKAGSWEPRATGSRGSGDQCHLPGQVAQMSVGLASLPPDKGREKQLEGEGRTRASGRLLVFPALRLHAAQGRASWGQKQPRARRGETDGSNLSALRPDCLPVSSPAPPMPKPHPWSWGVTGPSGSTKTLQQKGRQGGGFRHCLFALCLGGFWAGVSIFKSYSLKLSPHPPIFPKIQITQAPNELSTVIQVPNISPPHPLPLSSEFLQSLSGGPSFHSFALSRGCSQDVFLDHKACHIFPA